MSKNFIINGGVVIVENGVADAICGYEGTDEIALAFCNDEGLELHACHMVDGWDGVDRELESWGIDPDGEFLPA